MNLSNADFELIAKVILLLVWWALVHYITMNVGYIVDAFSRRPR